MAEETLQHLPDNVGDGVEDVNTTPDTELDHDTASDDKKDVTDENQTTPEESSKTREELEQERRRAVSELLKIRGKEKEARAQLDEDINDLLALAKDDLSVIDRLHARNPAKADKLTKAMFNMTYEEALAQAQNKEETPDIDALVNQKVAEALGKKDQEAESEVVQKELDRLFAQTGLAVTSPKFTRLMKEIQEIGVPQNVKQARAFFNLAQENMRGSTDADAVDMDSVATLSFNGMQTQNRMPKPSQAYYDAAKMNGRTREQADKAWKSLQDRKANGLSL